MIKNLLMFGALASLLGFVGCLSMGCGQKMKNSGSWGFELAQSVKFVHDAKQTADVEAEISWEFPSLEEWIMTADDESDGD